MLNLETIGNKITCAFVEGAIMGGIGYLGVRAFTTLNPLAGLAFAATYTVAGLVIDPVFSGETSSFASQVLGCALKTALAALVVIKGLGIALSSGAIASLAVGAILTPLAIGSAVVGGFVFIAGLAYAVYAIQKNLSGN